MCSSLESQVARGKEALSAARSQCNSTKKRLDVIQERQNELEDSLEVLKEVDSKWRTFDAISHLRVLRDASKEAIKWIV